MVEQSNRAFAGETGSPEARLADALIVAKPKIVSTGFDPVRLEGIVADLDAVITQKQRQAATTPVPAPGGERVVDALERLGFMQRVDKLVKAGRVTPRAEAHLRTLAGRSGDVKEFAAALSFGGLTLMGKTELRYVVSTLNTPEGQRPATWQECEAHVQAFDPQAQHPRTSRSRITTRCANPDLLARSDASGRCEWGSRASTSRGMKVQMRGRSTWCQSRTFQRQRPLVNHGKSVCSQNSSISSSGSVLMSYEPSDV